MTPRRSMRELEREIEDLQNRLRVRTPDDVTTPDVDCSQELLDAIESAAEWELQNGHDEPLPDELRDQLEAAGYDPDDWPPNPPGVES